jgi:hypothetical protein
MKIQISEATNKILEHLGGYETQFRKSISPDVSRVVETNSFSLVFPSFLMHFIAKLFSDSINNFC